MNSQVAKYVPLKTIVSYYLDDNNKSIGDFDALWITALRGLVRIGLDVSWEVLTVRLLMQKNATFLLPPDCIRWTRIGVLTGEHTVSTLKINRSLTKLKDNNPDRLQYLFPDVGSLNSINFDSYPFYLNYWYNGIYTPLFGAGNGLIQYGEVIVDELNGVIVVDPNYAYSDLILEYVSVPQLNEDYTVQIEAQDALISYIRWQKSMGPGPRKAAEDEFYRDLRVARRNIKPIRLQEINQFSRQYSGYKLKA